MTKRERIIAALSHKETDFIPTQVDFTAQEYERVAEYLGDPSFWNQVDNHISGAYYAGYPEEIEGRPGFFKDDFGVVWNRTGADRDIGVTEGKRIEDLETESITLGEPPIARIRENYEYLMSAKGDTFTFGQIGFSMFERAWSLCSMEDVLMGMVLFPDAIHKLLDEICEYNMKIIDVALEYDIDGFHFGDDWGQQKGLIMGAEHWRTFIKPRMKKMYSKVKAAGKFVSQHSCGDIEEIFDDLIEIGLDCYQTFQPEIYDIQKVKDTYGDKLSFWGGISTQQLLPFATPEKVASETRRIMNIMGKNGGYILAPTHSVPGDVPPENIVAMLDAFKNQSAK